MKNLPRIYLDMDGVLVNFEKQLEDTIKMSISKWMKLLERKGGILSLQEKIFGLVCS